MASAPAPQKPKGWQLFKLALQTRKSATMLGFGFSSGLPFALLIGTLSLQLWGSGFWTWQVQVVAFLALSLASAYVGTRIVRSRNGETDQPLLNRRGEQMIGRTATLSEPIREGRGRIQLGDTLWRVSGPDLPVGARVRVTGASETDLELTVEPVEPVE